MRATAKMPGLACEYCRFETGDGLELQGLLVEPRRKSGRAVVHVHGWDGNCYENRFIDHAARAATATGYGFFAFNNRGHDYIADILRPGTGDYLQLGGMYERLADCIPDIGAALDSVARRGYRQVILQGHSHGAIKATHYVATRRDRRVRGLVLLSPSDDLGWGRKLMGKRFDAACRTAGRLVKAGRVRELLPEGMFSYPVSAGTFLDAFGPDSIAAMFNLSRTERREFPELGSIRVPVLVAAGTVEEAFVGSANDYLAAIRTALANAPLVTTAVISGAPHNYLGKEAQLAAVLKHWLCKQASQKPKVKGQRSKPKDVRAGRKSAIDNRRFPNG
ncbi:MAG: alpha/beta fold hydrolase [bacterium]